MEFLFKQLVEVTSEVIWAWSYLYGNVSNQKLYFNNYVAIRVIYFFFFNSLMRYTGFLNFLCFLIEG